MARLIPVSGEIRKALKELGITVKTAARPLQLPQPDGETIHHLLDCEILRKGKPPLKLRLQEYYLVNLEKVETRDSFSFHLGLEYSGDAIMRFENHGNGPHAHLPGGPPLGTRHAYQDGDFRLKIPDPPVSLKDLSLDQFLLALGLYLKTDQLPLEWLP